MSIRNWESSLKKWEAVRKHVKEKKYGLTDIFDNDCKGTCGFCYKFNRSYVDVIPCIKCPLYPKTCVRDDDGKSTFWLLRKKGEEYDRKEFLRLVNLMIRAIRRHKDKF